MGRPRRTAEDISRRRKALVGTVAVLMVLVGWATAVFAVAGGSGSQTADSGKDSAGGPGGEQTRAGLAPNEATPQATRPEPGESKAALPRNSRGEGQSSSTGDDSGERASNPEGRGRARGEGGGAAEDFVRSEAPPGNALTETERRRARFAAARFVSAAYGYSGHSEREYRTAVEQASLATGLYRSPGGKRIQSYAEEAGEHGISAAAALESFEITRAQGSRIEGVARFRVGEGYTRYGKIEGERTSYEQRLTLSPVYSTYRVTWAEVEKKVSPEVSRGEASERSGHREKAGASAGKRGGA